MKNIIISLVFLGLAGLGYAQNTSETMETVSLKGVTVSPDLNNHYRSTVQKGMSSSSVIGLENKVARYNLLESPLYKGEDKLYKLTFRNHKGFILATYNKTGKILSSQEQFRDIAFPSHIRNYIYKEYPGWSVAANSYKVNYNMNRDVKKVYKTDIEKDDDRKTIKIVTFNN